MVVASGETGNLAQILITFGGLFLLGLVADLLGRHTPLPRVTLLLLSGFIIGPSVLDILPGFTGDWFPILTQIALSMIGFLLGQQLTLPTLRELGRPVMALSLSVVLVTALLVALLLLLTGTPLAIALLLAGIATATAPAATMDVVRESGVQGQFPRILLGVVAIDDAWGLLLFSLLLALANSLLGGGNSWTLLLAGGWEIAGAICLGLALGLPMAYLTGRLSPGTPTQAEALGMVLLCAGFSVATGVSFILSAMVMGAVVANLARHHEFPFHEIEGIEWPSLILFFLLAGASLELNALLAVGGTGIAYIVARIGGRIVGVQLGSRLGETPIPVRSWMGIALLPQAGVAVGMALIAAQRFPQLGTVILPIILGATVFFELLGPPLTRWALKQAGENSPPGG